MQEEDLGRHEEIPTTHLFDLSRELQTMLGFDGSFRMANRATSQVLGLAEDQLRGMAFGEIFHPDDKARAVAAFEKLRRTGRPIHGLELRVHSHGHGYRWTSWDATVSVEDQIIFAIGRDVTFHRARDEELQAVRELASRVVQSSVDGILAFDGDARYTLWNPAMERIAGLTADEVLGRRAYDVFPFLVQTGHDEFLEGALRGEVGVAPDTPFSIPETNKEGFFQSVYSPLFGNAGEVVGGIAIVRDVSERKDLEASKERFIADAAHELRTPIGILHGFASLLSTRADELSPDVAQGAFEAIVTQSERMRTLVADLLDLSRLERGGGASRRERVSIAAVVEDALALSPPPDAVTVSRHLDPRARVVAEASRLQQVVTNLLVNAYRYGGSNVSVDASEGGGVVELSIFDDGPGVPPEDVDHLFDPFSRGANSSQEGGSGLGLAIVRGIVEGCGGVVAYIAGNPGARFHITLPSA